MIRNEQIRTKPANIIAFGMSKRNKRQAKEICLSERRAIHYQLRATRDVGKFQ